MFCSISTGGTYSTRELFTSLGTTTINLKHPCIINGITELARNQDLIDRVVRIEVSKSEAYIPEPKLMERFEQARPEILGGLLQLLSDALRVLPEMRGHTYRDRMADFIMLGEAVFKARNKASTTFSDLYLNKKREAVVSAIESSPVLAALKKYMNQQREYRGNYQTLLDELRLPAYSHSRDRLPYAARGLSQIIKRNLSALSLIGINFEFCDRKKNNGYTMVITYDQ